MLACRLYAEQVVAEFSDIQVNRQYPFLAPQLLDQHRKPDLQPLADKAF